MTTTLAPKIDTTGLLCYPQLFNLRSIKLSALRAEMEKRADAYAKETGRPVDRVLSLYATAVTNLDAVLVAAQSLEAEVERLTARCLELGIATNGFATLKAENARLKEQISGAVTTTIHMDDDGDVWRSFSCRSVEIVVQEEKVGHVERCEDDILPTERAAYDELLESWRDASRTAFAREVVNAGVMGRRSA